MCRSIWVALVAALLAACVTATPASAADNRTVVAFGFSHTETFDDDICGPRASTVTFTATMAQSQFVPRPDGTFSFRDVAVVTESVDFVDSALTDYTGRLVEVNHFILTPGENTFVVSNTFHDFGGDLKIFERTNLKVVQGEVVVDRFLLDVIGCP